MAVMFLLDLTNARYKKLLYNSSAKTSYTGKQEKHTQVFLEENIPLRCC